jgi:pimeloyl-ACP methyl ester carboxylesterase/AraC-like DNA-binding protein
MKSFKQLIPRTQYTKSGDINIAYQIFGKGDIDLVYIPGWISNIDLMWTCPELVNFFQELGKMCRIILFDKRGTGLSDRVVELSTLEERMEDINSVMKAVGSEKAILFGHSEGGSVSALFSATYPEKVISLITFGIFAKRRYSEDYPWAPTDKERQKVYDMIENNWCSDEMQLHSLAPSKANDKNFMNWLTSYFRSGASPSAALKLTKMNTDVNIVDVLRFINVPTLIMQRTKDIDVKVEEGRFIADRIQNSKYIEFDGEDHLFWIGNTKEILDEIKDFIKNSSTNITNKKGVKTLLFGHISNAKKSNIISDKLREYFDKRKGSIVFLDGCCFAVSFNTPGKTVEAGLELLDIFQNLKASIKIGAYLKENDLEINQKLNFKEKRIIKCILSKIDSNSLFVTETIKNLLSGSNFDFTHKTSILNNYSNDFCKLFKVSNKVLSKSTNGVIKMPRSTSNIFLEDLVRTIENNILEKDFGVVKLCTLMGLSERQLQRKTKEFADKSPNQLITLIRLKKAKEALLSFRLSSVSEVAFYFGFSSPSYFTKCFKKEFNISPSDLKESQNDYSTNLEIAAF